jgi:hypothetical protein
MEKSSQPGYLLVEVFSHWWAASSITADGFYIINGSYI